MDNGTGRGEAWVHLIREVIASRRLLGAVVLVLALSLVAVVVILVLLAIL